MIYLCKQERNSDWRLNITGQVKLLGNGHGLVGSDLCYWEINEHPRENSSPGLAEYFMGYAGSACWPTFPCLLQEAKTYWLPTASFCLNLSLLPLSSSWRTMGRTQTTTTSSWRNWRPCGRLVMDTQLMDWSCVLFKTWAVDITSAVSLEHPLIYTRCDVMWCACTPECCERNQGLWGLQYPEEVLWTAALPPEQGPPGTRTGSCRANIMVGTHSLTHSLTRSLTTR